MLNCHMLRKAHVKIAYPLPGTKSTLRLQGSAQRIAPEPMLTYTPPHYSANHSASA